MHIPFYNNALNMMSTPETYPMNQPPSLYLTTNGRIPRIERVTRIPVITKRRIRPIRARVGIPTATLKLKTMRGMCAKGAIVCPLLPRLVEAHPSLGSLRAVLILDLAAVAANWVVLAVACVLRVGRGEGEKYLPWTSHSIPSGSRMLDQDQCVPCPAL
jgi:hypothetical protein